MQALLDHVADAGIGAWPDAALVEQNGERLDGAWRDARFDIAFWQRALVAWGYDVAVTDVLDAPTRFALEASLTVARAPRGKEEDDVLAGSRTCQRSTSRRAVRRFFILRSIKAGWGQDPRLPCSRWA